MVQSGPRATLGLTALGALRRKRCKAVRQALEDGILTKDELLEFAKETSCSGARELKRYIQRILDGRSFPTHKMTEHIQGVIKKDSMDSLSASRKIEKKIDLKKRDVAFDSRRIKERADIRERNRVALERAKEILEDGKL